MPAPTAGTKTALGAEIRRGAAAGLAACLCCGCGAGCKLPTVSGASTLCCCAGCCPGAAACCAADGCSCCSGCRGAIGARGAPGGCIRCWLAAIDGGMLAVGRRLLLPGCMHPSPPAPMPAAAAAAASQAPAAAPGCSCALCHCCACCGSTGCLAAAAAVWDCGGAGCLPFDAAAGARSCCKGVICGADAARRGCRRSGGCCCCCFSRFARFVLLPTGLPVSSSSGPPSEAGCLSGACRQYGGSTGKHLMTC